MTWNNTNTLVTGAGGFIGSHLVERLVGEDARVHALVEYNRDGHRGWLEGAQASNLEVHLGDVRDPELVEGLVDDADVVFHLAALVGIPYSYEAPRSYLDTNTEGTLNVLEAVRDSTVERLVHTSTSEVYGTAQYVPIDEDHPLQAQSPYAATKIAADKLAESYHRSFDLPVVTLRPFNTFGPRQSARAVIPTIISQCLARDKVELGNLHPTRDFNYVANTVDGFLAAASPDAEPGTVVNVGSGREISIGDLAETIIDLVGEDVELVTDDERKRPEDSEVDRLLADNEAAKQKLDWKPRVSLEEGLERTIEWMRDNVDRYRAGSYDV